MAYIVMAYIRMAYIVMAYIVMALNLITRADTASIDRMPPSPTPPRTLQTWLSSQLLAVQFFSLQCPTLKLGMPL